MYLILHGFSRRNAGDGLLVELTLEALEDAGVDRADCALLALDPDSFSEPEQVHRAPGEPSARPSFKLGLAGLELIADSLSGGKLGTVGSLAGKAKALIAVGGGYMVADSGGRQLGVLFNHMIQLRSAARSGVPTIYMPQSIGPLNGAVGKAALKQLRQIDQIYVRDDESLAEVGGANVTRCGDLAVMKLARTITAKPPQKPKSHDIVIVARSLPKAGDYERRIQELGAGFAEQLWAVQADVEGPRSDRVFYDRLGVRNSASLDGLLDADRAGVVISVRLHGALTALIRGYPAIHLAYERKGWGAYEDLGIVPYVHDARSFDPSRVIAQANELRQDAGPFWARIRAAAPRLSNQYQNLIADLRSRLAG